MVLTRLSPSAGTTWTTGGDEGARRFRFLPENTEDPESADGGERARHPGDVCDDPAGASSASPRVEDGRVAPLTGGLRTSRLRSAGAAAGAAGGGGPECLGGG